MPLATEVQAILPDSYKFFIVASLNKTLNRALLCIFASIIAKYHDTFQIILLIISK
jgi:hypothetical protein